MSEIDLSTIDRAIKMHPQSVVLKEIRSALSRGDEEYAYALYYHDGDKLATYPGAALAVEHYVGRRMHGEHNCKANFCRWGSRERVRLANEHYSPLKLSEILGEDR